MLCACLVLSVAACARPETVADKRVDEMNETIHGVQVDQDRSPLGGRIDDDSGALGTAPNAPQPAAAKTAPRPPRVVQLGEDEAPGSDDPDDPTARPEIRVVGPGGGAASARPTRRGASSPRQDDAEPRRAYEAARALVDAKQYDRALEALNAFLVRYPDDPFAENAMYWRGEIYFAQREYLRAAEQFEAVVARFRDGRKAPDALLEIGMCHDRLGAHDRAREYWNRLEREYPRSDAARRIPKEAR